MRDGGLLTETRARNLEPEHRLHLPEHRLHLPEHRLHLPEPTPSRAVLRYDACMAPRGQRRGVRRGLGWVLAQGLALVVANASSVSCREQCDDWAPDRYLGRSVRLLDAGGLDGADPDGGLHLDLSIDASSLDEVLAMPCEEICRQIEPRPIESCSGPDRAPEEVWFDPSRDAAVAVSTFSVRCVPVTECTSGCIPWGE